MLYIFLKNLIQTGSLHYYLLILEMIYFGLTALAWGLETDHVKSYSKHPAVWYLETTKYVIFLLKSA